MGILPMDGGGQDACDTFTRAMGVSPMDEHGRDSRTTSIWLSGNRGILHKYNQLRDESQALNHFMRADNKARDEMDQFVQV